MSALEEIVQAMLGWRDLAQGRDGWRGRFRLDAGGARSAASLYGLAVVLNVGMQMFLAGQFTLPQVVVNLALNLAPLPGLAVAIWASLMALQQRRTLFDVMVPAIWGLAFALFVGLPLSLLPLPTGPLLIAALGYFYYRLGRAACGFAVGVSLAFAVVCVVLLVAMPLSLYMLVAALPGIS